MRIGAGSSRLGVAAGSPLGGYADRTDPASGTLDPLEVHCVAFTSGGDSLVLVVADVICVNADLAEAVAASVATRVGVPASHVWTLATHTHSGPDVNCGVGDLHTPPPWLASIPATAADAAEHAVRDQRDTGLQWHTVDVRDVGAVRSVVDAPAVVPVDTLVASADGQLHGVLVVLPVHPTVLPASNSSVSGDLASAVRRALHRRLRTGSSAPWVVVATGCAGDISTRTTRVEQTPAELTRLADLAAAQLAIGLNTPPIAHAAVDGPLRVVRRRLRLPVRDEDAPQPIAAAGAGSVVADRIAHTLRQGQAVAAERASRHPDGRVDLEVAAADLGGITVVAIGAEPFLRVRELPVGPAVVLGYANGYAGYLPDADGFRHVSYESLSSPFHRDAALTAVRAAEHALNHPDTEEPQ